MSDSNILADICKEIGKALPKVKVTDHDFGGQFYTTITNKNFENYINMMQSKTKNVYKANTIEDYFKRKAKKIYSEK